MKRIIFTGLLSVLFSGIVYSQNDYIKYYQLINKTKEHQKRDLNDSLTIFLKQAFSLVDYILIEDLKYGKSIAKKYKDEELLNICTKAMASSKTYLNIELKAQLDSIGKEDQRIRGSKYYKAKNYYRKCLNDTTFNCKEKKRLESKELMEEWWRVDSSNVEFVKDVIFKQGFPSEKIVGKETNSMVSIILLHYDKDTANNIMGASLYTALKEGSIEPKMYAWIIDRHLMMIGKEQIYYTIPTPWIEIKKERRDEIEKNRFAIGEQSLSERKVKVKKNGVRVSYK